MIWAILIGGILVAALFLGLRGRGSKSRTAHRRRDASRDEKSRGSNASPGKARVSQPKGPYAAVAIRPGKHACARAHERSNIRYLASAAPTIPVLGCDSGNCQCNFVHYPDRRTEENGDRRMGIGLQSQLYGSEAETGERRNRRGRRITDR